MRKFVSNSTPFPDAFLEAMRPFVAHSFDDFIAACQRPLRKSIRVNTLKISLADFYAIAEEKHWQLTPIPWCDTGFWIQADESHALLGNTPEHMAGLFYIQEASSMLPVSALFQSQDTQLIHDSYAVLDMAAAPGSKTTQIAALMQHQGVVIANEFSASRVKVLHANLERCGVRHSAITHLDGRVLGQWLAESFDAILLDAPCSGEGTIRKDPTAFKNWALDAIQTIACTQRELIESAFHALKVGGVLVYSTCTLSPEENQAICWHLKNRYPDAVRFEPLTHLFNEADKALTDEGFLHVFPHHYDCEGFFVARIRKIAAVKLPKSPKSLRQFPFQPLSKKEEQTLAAQLSSELALTLPKQAQLWQRDKEIWLFPEALIPFLPLIRFSRMGIKVAEQHKQGYRWQHQLVCALTASPNPHYVHLSAEQAQLWYMGRDIAQQNTNTGFALVCYRNTVIGIGKWIGNKIKNGLPRERVNDHAAQ